MEGYLTQAVREFGNYLEKRIEEQHQRPYSERDDIERTLRVYNEVKEEFTRSFGQYFSKDQNNLSDAEVCRYWSERGLSVRTANRLTSAKIQTLEQLTRQTTTDLIRLRSFGKVTLREVEKFLKNQGLSLSDKSNEQLGK